MSNSLQTSFNSVLRDHPKGQTRDNTNMRFIHTKIDMCSYIISVVHMCRIISCLKGFALFNHISRTYGMHMSLEIY